MFGSQAGIHLNSDIPSEFDKDYMKCRARNRNAAAAAKNGDLAEAADMLKTNLEWCKSNLSKVPMHPMTLWHLGELGILLVSMARFNEAIVYVGEAYGIREAIDPDDKDTLRILGYYVHALVGDNHLDLAAGQCEKLWAMYKKAFGDEAEATLEIGRQTARCWSRAAANETINNAKRPIYLDKAQEIHEQLLATWESKGPAGTLDTAEARADLAVHHGSLGDYSTAESMFQQCLDTLVDLQLEQEQEPRKQDLEELCQGGLGTVKDQLKKEHQRKDEEAKNPKPALASPSVQPMEGGECQEDSSMMSPGEEHVSKPPATLGSICDATQQLMGDACVDVWFADIQRINNELFNPYRRQACKRVKIGVLDTGIDMKNAAFKDGEVRQRIKKRIDFLDPSGKGTAKDECGHGTHCAALVNKIAPAADIYIGRVAADFNSGLDDNVVAKAITVALSPKGHGDASQNWGVDILSLSLGFQHFSEAIETALQTSVRKGKIVLAAASNNGTRHAMAYPAWDSHVIAVNSSNGRGRPSDFNPPAAPGKTLTILGENVPSAWITSAPTKEATNLSGVSPVAPTASAPADLTATRRMSGTSVATPIAAGVVALLLELAMIEVPNDQATQATLRGVLPHLKRQAGLSELLVRKAVGTGDFRNIVPMDLLSPDLTVGENAAVIKGALARKFRF